MDPDILDGIATVLGLGLPLLGVTFGGLLLLARSKLGDALARRIAGDQHHPACEAQIEALYQEVSALRTQLQETTERLDFAERLLARPSPE
jgi:hypothetical protein